MLIDFFGNFHIAIRFVFPCWYGTPPSKTEIDWYNQTSDDHAKENTGKIWADQWQSRPSPGSRNNLSVSPVHSV